MVKNSGLSGPFALTFDGIEAAVRRRGAGVFALGSTDFAGRFSVQSVGRSDEDVKMRLREFIGAGTHFKFDYFSGERAAFEKECELFHDLQPPGNRVHPSRPRGSTLKCPRCQIFARPW